MDEKIAKLVTADSEEWGRRLNWVTHPLAFYHSKGVVFARGTKKRLWEDLSEGEGVAGSGDGAAELFGGFEPLPNDDFYVGESFLVGLSVGGAAGEFGEFGDERFVGLASIEDDFVFGHWFLQPSVN